VWRYFWSFIFKRFTPQGVLKAGYSKKSMVQCGGSFVVDTPVECGVAATSAAKVGPSAGVRCDLPRNRPPFLGH
jgi:hypothetical protein